MQLSNNNNKYFIQSIGNMKINIRSHSAHKHTALSEMNNKL